MLVPLPCGTKRSIACIDALQPLPVADPRSDDVLAGDFRELRIGDTGLLAHLLEHRANEALLVRVGIGAAHDHRGCLTPTLPPASLYSVSP